MRAKLLPQNGELYVFAESRDRVAMERAMRRRQLKWLWRRLRQFTAMKLTRKELLMKLGSARSQAPTAWRLITITVDKKDATFSYRLDRNKLRLTRRSEGRYLLRSNLTEGDPALLWATICNWSRLSRPSKISRMISRCGRSSINGRRASRRTSSSSSWPIAYMRRSVGACMLRLHGWRSSVG